MRRSCLYYKLAPFVLPLPHVVQLSQVDPLYPSFQLQRKGITVSAYGFFQLFPCLSMGVIVLLVVLFVRVVLVATVLEGACVEEGVYFKGAV